MEDLLDFKDAQIKALQKKLQEVEEQLNTAKELLSQIVKDYDTSGTN